MLYRMPVLGGPSTKIIEGVEGSITLSPDGGRIAFVRGDWREGSDTLMVCNADGTGERRLATRGTGEIFLPEGPAWSPDREVIVCVGYQEGSCALLEVDVASGEERLITPQTWPLVLQVAWLGDGSGLMAIIADQSAGFFPQIWHVSYPSGTCRRVTQDLNEYAGVSLTNDSQTLLAIQSECVSTIWVSASDEPTRADRLASGKYAGYFGVAWTPDGRIVHAGRDFDIWISDSDGGNQRLLTVDDHSNGMPCVTPDGRYIVFCSFRTRDDINIWRMDIDGGNPERLTTGMDDYDPRCSPDGKWVVYRAFVFGIMTLWRVSIDGGDAVQLTREISYEPAISSDGKWIACFYKGDPAHPHEQVVAILPFEGGDPAKTFDLPMNVNTGSGLRWTFDGRAVTYVVHRGGASNIWSQPMDGGPPTQVTDFKDQEIFAFDWSSDGKLACSRGVINNDVVIIRNFR